MRIEYRRNWVIPPWGWRSVAGPKSELDLGVYLGGVNVLLRVAHRN
jgi:hypothetical protein